MAASNDEALISQLAIFETPPVLLSIEDSYWEVVNTITALDGSSNQLVFVIPSDAQAYTNLNNTFLCLTCQYKKGDSTNLEDKAEVGPVQYPATSVFQSLDMYINDSRVTNYSNDFAYVNWFHTFCQTESAKKTYLQLGLYYPDTYTSSQHFNQPNPFPDGAAAKKNQGLADRADWFSESKEVTLITRLYTPPHNITKHLPNRIKIEYVFTLNPMRFFTMTPTANPDNAYLFSITGAKLYVKRVLPSPAVQMAHEKILATKNAQFHTQFFTTKTFNIPQGSYDFVWENVFQQDLLPASLYIGLLKSSTKSGDFKANPFDFQLFDISTLVCYLGSKKLPNIDFDMSAGGRNQQALWLTYLAMGYMNSNQGPSNLDRKSFSNGAGLMGFDLSRDSAPGVGYTNTNITSDHVRLEGRFKTPTPHPITVLVFGLVSGTLEINKYRQVFINY